MTTDAMTATALAARIEACFRRIEAERMADVPILNRALGVRVVGVRSWRDDWLCVLLTPWFMSVVLLGRYAAADDSRHSVPLRPVGAKEIEAFPSGRYEFIHAHEPDIGAYRTCSLFSPVFEFSNQETAVATAEAALVALLDPGHAERPEDDDGMDKIWRGERPTSAAEDATCSSAIADERASAVADTDACESRERPIALSRRAFLSGRPRAEEGP